jgi:hypothetical protein
MGTDDFTLQNKFNIRVKPRHGSDRPIADAVESADFALAHIQAISCFVGLIDVEILRTVQDVDFVVQLEIVSGLIYQLADSARESLEEAARLSGEIAK